MLKQFLSTLIPCFILAFCNPAQGTVVTELYSVKTPVKSTSKNERNQALSHALETVFIKVSGNSKITSIPQMNKALKNADHYVQAFNYIHTTSKQNASNLLLNVRFNRLSINELLHQNKQTIWKEDRPSILVWLVVQKYNGEELIGYDSKQMIAKTLMNSASKRGLPILLPMLDLSDLQQISTSDISDMREGIIRQVSKRYSPDQILIGCIEATNKEQITVYWRLLSEEKVNENLTWETKGHQLTKIISASIDHFADIIAKDSIHHTQIKNNIVQLEISHLDNIDEYATLIHYLNNIKGVAKVDVLHISKTNVTVRLVLNINVPKLQRAFQIDSVLLPVKMQTAPQQDEVLYYSFNKQAFLSSKKGLDHGVSNTTTA